MAIGLGSAKIDVVVDSTSAERGFRVINRGFDRMRSRARRALTGITRGFDRMKAAMFSMRGLIAAMGLGFLAKSFLDAGSTAEQLNVRLSVMLGSVEKGAELFQRMNEFAGKTPFEFEQVMQSATQLAGIMRGGVDQINAWMPLIGDLAATTGLSIQQTTDQVSRMLSAGAGAADLFRDRGVLAMLGFTAGVQVSAEETQRILVESWTKTGSQFRGATEKLAATWVGAMSMLKDRWFQFQLAVMESGVLEWLTTFAGEVLGAAGEMDELKTKAKSMADSVIRGFDSMLGALGFLLDGFRFMKIGFDSLILGSSKFLEIWQRASAFFADQAIRDAKRELGNFRDTIAEANVITQEMIDKHSLLQLAVLNAYAKWKSAIEDVSGATQTFEEKWEEILVLIGKDMPSEAIDALRARMKLLFSESGKGFGDMADDVELTDEQMEQLGITVSNVEDKVEELTTAADLMGQVLKDVASSIHQAFVDAFINVFEDGIDSFKDFADSILDIFIRMLAEMAALALARPIIVPIIQVLGGVLGLSEEIISGITAQFGVTGAGEAGAGGFSSLLFGSSTIAAGPPTAAGVFPTVAGGGGLLSGFTGGLSGLMGALGGGAGALAAAGPWAILGMIVAGIFGGNVAGGGIGAGAGAFIGTLILPGIGTVVGAIIGGLLGAFGLGDSDPVRLRVSGLNREPRGSGPGRLYDSDLGGFRFDLAGTITNSEMDQWAAQIITFDKAIADMITAFGGADTPLLEGIIETLANWDITLTNEALTLENLLEGRFGQVLLGLGGAVRDLVEGAAEGVEAQVAYLNEFLGFAAQVRDQLEAMQIELHEDFQSDKGFLNFVARMAQAVGGDLNEIARLWSLYFEGFLTEQERAARELEMITAELEGLLGPIGLTMDNIADFSALFEAALPMLTPEQVVQWLQAGEAILRFMELSEILAGAAGGLEGALENFAALFTDLELLQVSLHTAMGNNLNTILDLAAAYDGSSAAEAELMGLLQARYVMEAEMIAAIGSAMLAVQGIIANSIENIKLSQMTEQQQYDYLTGRAEELAALLPTLTDPAEIERTVNEINRLTNQAYNLLSPEQQAIVAEEFISFLEDVGQLAADRLNAIFDETIGLPGSGGPHDQVITAIEEAMQRVADAQQEAADTQSEAAGVYASGSVTFTHAVNEFGRHVATLGDGRRITGGGGVTG